MLRAEPATGRHALSPSVAIIVLNWNRADDTLACVASLRALRYDNFLIVVVDNGSDAACVNKLRTALPDVTLLTNSTNLGFAEGNNIGIRHALTKGVQFVLLLNNDTIVDPNLLTALTAAAGANPQAGFLGARIYYHADPARIWMGNPVWDAAACRFHHAGLNQLDAGNTEAPAAASYVCGCAMLVTRAAIETAGLMDARFFCYFEEVDWCFRGARQGFTSLYVPAAKVWHKVSVSSGGKQSPIIRYFRARNSLLWAERHLSARQRWRVFHNSAGDALGHMGWDGHTTRARAQRAYWNLLTFHRDPMLKAWRRGVLDYLGRRFGDAPAAVKQPARAGSATETTPPAPETKSADVHARH